MEQWYAVHTKPRKEPFVRDYLAGRGIEIYLPALAVPNKRYPRRTREAPFFARYLFAHLDLVTVSLSSVNWAPGVTGVVSFGGQPTAVPDPVIRYLQARLAASDGRSYLGGLPLQANDRLRVVAGPLKGLEAIFDRCLSPEGRARVFVELLGRLTACEIDLSCLEPL